MRRLNTGIRSPRTFSSPISKGPPGPVSCPWISVVPFLHRPMGYVGESMRATSAAKAVRLTVVTLRPSAGFSPSSGVLLRDRALRAPELVDGREARLERVVGRFRFELCRLPAAAESLREEVREFLSTELADFPTARRAFTWMGGDPALQPARWPRGVGSG